MQRDAVRRTPERVLYSGLSGLEQSNPFSGRCVKSPQTEFYSGDELTMHGAWCGPFFFILVFSLLASAEPIEREDFEFL